MRSLDQKLSAFVGDIKPELKTKITEATSAAAAKIHDSCRKDIEEINKLVEKYMRIPDNVLLFRDRMHMEQPKGEQVEALKEECNQLERVVNEVRAVRLMIDIKLIFHSCRTHSSSMLWTTKGRPTRISPRRLILKRPSRGVSERSWAGISRLISWRGLREAFKNCRESE